MMASRFRSLIWVGIASTAGLSCYLVTQSVAAERADLAKVERNIRHGRIAIRDLETELGTRGSLAQIERWNRDQLALVAPKAAQFLPTAASLASLDASALPQPVQVAARSAPAPAAAPLRADPGVTLASNSRIEGEPLLRSATYVKPPIDRIALATRKIALIEKGPLDAKALADLGRIASTERGAGGDQ